MLKLPPIEYWLRKIADRYGARSNVRAIEDTVRERSYLLPIGNIVENESPCRA